MKTAVINIKTNTKVKKQAHELAKELGFSLSSVINAYLKQFIRTKSVDFSLVEEPSEYMKRALERSEEDIKKGRVVTFKNSQDALSYLENIANEPKYKKNRLLKRVPETTQEVSA